MCSSKRHWLIQIIQDKIEKKEKIEVTKQTIEACNFNSVIDFKNYLTLYKPSWKLIINAPFEKTIIIRQ